MITLLGCAAALASSPSGLGVPNHAGSWAGATQPGVFGLSITPTAAHTEKGEALLDIALIRSNFTVQLEGDEVVDRKGLSPLPFLAATIPLHKRVGLGLEFGAPFARVGTSPEDNPFRLWSISGGILLYEPRVSLAVQATDQWTFGVGLRGGYTDFDSYLAMDTGATIYQLIGEDAKDLIGDPLLEGTRTIDDGMGLGWGYTLGVRYEPVERVVVVASYLSAMSTPLTGTLEIEPSKDLALLLRADMIGEWSFPEQANFGLSFPVGHLDFHTNVEYIAWGTVSNTIANLNDAYVVSEDPFLEGILGAYGLNDPAALGNIESSSQAGMLNILTGGVHVHWHYEENLTFMFGATYTPGAVQNEWISPANIDLNGMDYRIGAKWRPSERLELGLGLDIWDMDPRVVTNSIAKPTNPMGLPNTPNANGRYTLSLQRLGLSTVYRF